MRTKLSEKNFFAGIVIFVTGLLILLKTKIFIEPFRISEINVLWSLVAISLIGFGLSLFRRSVVKA